MHGAEVDGRGPWHLAVPIGGIRGGRPAVDDSKDPAERHLIVWLAHAVTSASNAWISSNCLISASISSNGRGGT